jgi:hypothetical protein
MNDSKSYMGILPVARFADFRLPGKNSDFFIYRRNKVADLFVCPLLNSEFTDHAGFKGFFRPKNETPDGKLENNKGNDGTKSEKTTKYNMFMQSAKRSRELGLINAEQLFLDLARQIK